MSVNSFIAVEQNKFWDVQQNKPDVNAWKQLNIMWFVKKKKKKKKILHISLCEFSF